MAWPANGRRAPTTAMSATSSSNREHGVNPMSKTAKPAAVLKGLLPVAAALLLSACSATHDLTQREDAYVEPLHYERHPIEVSRGTMKLKLATSSPRLSRSQENALLRFSDEARGAATGAI